MPRIPKAPLLLGAGLLSAGLLGLTGTGTLSTVMAQVVTSPNVATLGHMVLELRSGEKGKDVCSSAADVSDVFVCKTIQPLSGRRDLLPGEEASTTVTAVNTGSVDPSSFTLTSDACRPIGEPTDERSKEAFSSICKQVHLRMTVGGETVFDGAVAELERTAIPLDPPAEGRSTEVVFVTSTPLDLGDAYQGLGVSVPMTWTFEQ